MAQKPSPAPRRTGNRRGSPGGTRPRGRTGTGRPAGDARSNSNKNRSRSGGRVASKADVRVDASRVRGTKVVGRSVDGGLKSPVHVVTKLVTVSGTWPRTNDWWKPSSLWWAFMRPQGFEPALLSPFEWEGEIGSSWQFWRRMGLGNPDVNGWVYGGKHFKDYVRGLGPLNVVLHSHGAWPVFYAAAEGVEINRLLTIGTPYRADMEDVITQARPNITTWWHVCDFSWDWIALLGRIGDGVIGGGRTMPQADQNLRLSDIGHSRLLRDPNYFGRWSAKGVHLINFLHGRPDVELNAAPE